MLLCQGCTFVLHANTQLQTTLSLAHSNPVLFRPTFLLTQFLIEAVENAGRCQRSDHVRKAINYVKILLDKQADPNARDEWGHGHALHYAIWCGHMEVVKLLLDAEGCNVEVDTGK